MYFRSVPLLEKLLNRQQVLRQGTRFYSGGRKHVKESSFPFIKVTAGIAIGGLLLYDGYMNKFTYFGASGRFLRSLKVVTLISKDYLLLFAQEDESDLSYNDKLKQTHLKSAERILDACLVNGGLYIKVGQGVAAINHILPEEYTATLSKLQDKCIPTSKEEVVELFREEFGKNPEEVFQEFDYKPIAAASLAQVFKAKLHSGEEVAVKVQYANLQKRFPSDLGTIIFLQDIIEYFFKSYNFGWMLHYVRKNLEKELDFLAEGKNAERCAKDLQHLKYVYIPKVFWEFSKTRILTLEWINGYKVSDMGSIEAKNVNLNELDKKLFTVFSEQIFKTGFVHADPHPGNIFFRKNSKGELQLILLDHGLYEGLSKKIRLQLCKFWEAAVLRDEPTMKEAAKMLNITGYKMFAEILFQLPYEIKGARLKTKLTDEDMQYMQNMAKTNFEKIMNTLKQMPTNMLLVVRNLNTIRAISKEHGDPVDRIKLMARFAQKCVYRDTNRVFGFFKWLSRRMRFEYCLLKSSLKISLLAYYLDTLHKLGRSPEGSSILFKVPR